MKKKEKRYHRKVSGKVASVFIQEVYLPKAKTYRDKYSSIYTGYYDYICACVSNSRRKNNDWWNNDKTCDNMYNRSTGNTMTFIAIADMLTKHIETFIKQYGYYCCMVDGTDERRITTYFKMVRHYAKKKKLKLTTVATDDGLLCWFE